MWGNNFGWKAYWESNSEVFYRSRICQQSMGCAGRAPSSELHPCICLITEVNHGKPQLGWGLRKLVMLTVFMWYSRIRGGGRVLRTGGRSSDNKLHSSIRWWAVCMAFSGQLQFGEGVLFICVGMSGSCRDLLRTI
jgi:hypothetical protein